MSAFVEKQLYDAANAYYEGASILMHKKSSDSPVTELDLTQPALSCAASSLKLYLRCLLEFQGEDKDNVVDQMADLYQSLDDYTQSLILAKFDEYSNATLSSADLIGRLKALDNAFAAWRHPFEEETSRVNLEDLNDLIFAAKAVIVDFKPAWE